MILLANSLSAIGAIILLLGYYEITVRGREQVGMIYSGLGSLIMCVAFYLFQSNAFIALNLIWMCISAYGLFKRRKGPVFSRKEAGPVARRIAHCVLLSLAFSCLGFYATSNMEAVSWLSIGVMLMAFMFFSQTSISRKHYVVYSLIASLLAIPYVLYIANYSSAAQLSIDIIISLYSLAKMRTLDALGDAWLKS